MTLGIFRERLDGGYNAGLEYETGLGWMKGGGGGVGRIDTKERRFISNGNEIIVDLKVYDFMSHM